MIKVSVLYPTTEGSRFDMDYYLATHMPLVQEKLGDACRAVSVEEGVNAGAPGTAPTYHVITQMAFDSEEAFGTAFAPAAGDILSDIANFTDIAPVMQISSVLL